MQQLHEHIDQANTEQDGQFDSIKETLSALAQHLGVRQQEVPMAVEEPLTLTAMNVSEMITDRIKENGLSLKKQTRPA